jgi:hypothetical protein
MTPRRECSGCGAAIDEPEARYCGRCGDALAPPQPESPPTSPLGDVAARFAALRAHPHTEELLRHEPGGESSGRLMPLLAIALVVLVGLGVTLGLAAFCAPLALLPLTLVVLCVYAMAKQLGAPSASDEGPLARHLALVVEGQAGIESGPDLGQVADRTTLQLEDGSRHDVPTLGEVAARIAPGDIGVAFLRGGTLVEFGRVSV